jgi:hypothetical protein
MRNIDKAYEIEKQKLGKKLTEAQIYRSSCPFEYGIGTIPEGFEDNQCGDCLVDCWHHEFNEEFLFKKE